MKEFVITVNEQDEPVGVAEKMEAHEKALLHRAFSVFIFNDQNQVLLQQRALSKYHSGGKWTNSCCGHPRPGENILEAAQRRLNEEMGIVCVLNHQFTFMYKAALDNDLTENEIDHVFFGTYRGQPVLHPEEAMAYTWAEINEVSLEIKNHPEQFTEWFKICFDDVMKRR